MKKLITMLIASIVLALVPMASVAQATAPSKEANKIAKSRAKELKKDNWKVGGGLTLEAKLVMHSERLLNGEEELIGQALDGYRYTNTALNACIEAAITEYTKMHGDGIVKARVTADNELISEEEANNLVDMAEQNFMKILKGELGEPTIKLTKGEPSQKTLQMQCFWSISPKKLDAALNDGIKQAYEQAKFAQEAGVKHAERVSDFINNGQKIN